MYLDNQKISGNREITLPNLPTFITQKQLARLMLGFNNGFPEFHTLL